jgi:Flp pilus assembly CpaF family ATPase
MSTPLRLADVSALLAQTAGPLLPLLEDPSVMKIRVRSNGHTFTERFGIGRQREADMDVATLDPFLATIADLTGQEWREQSPSLQAAIPRLGLRIQAGRPPISPGNWVVLRKHPRQIFPLADFEAKGILRPAQTHCLQEALAQRRSVLVSGSVGSAKTSLVNALLDYLGTLETGCIVVVEDTPELMVTALEREFLQTYDGGRGGPPITMADHGRHILRLDPDWIVFGEVRGGEALDMLKSAQVGHPTIATIHAESAETTLLILEQRVQEVSVNPQRDLIGEAIDLIVHMQAIAGGWRCSGILAVRGWDGTAYRTERIGE